jgi:uncharacterized SAM-binding protein YcdF (DUF218 family)
MNTATNEVIILGAGMDTDGQEVRLSAAGEQRAIRFLQYYTENTNLFLAEGAQVICSGGYGRLSSGMERPTNPSEREGIVTADFLVRAGIPHKLIRTESESTSTIENFTNSMRLGYLTPKDYNEDQPLGVVSHPHHLQRALFLAAKLGFNKDGLTAIPTTEKDAALHELAIRTAYRALLLGANGADQLEAREAMPAKVLAAIRHG